MAELLQQTEGCDHDSFHQLFYIQTGAAFQQILHLHFSTGLLRKYIYPFLKSEEIFKKYKDIYEFMDKCFLTEARNNLTFSYPDFDNLNESEQHDAVLSIIALHSYAYLMSRVHFEDVEKGLWSN